MVILLVVAGGGETAGGGTCDIFSFPCRGALICVDRSRSEVADTGFFSPAGN